MSQSTNSGHLVFEATGDSSASESDQAHALEVTFGADNVHRRKSSLATEDSVKPDRSSPAQKPACFVHGLLEQHRRSNQQTNNRDTQAVRTSPIKGDGDALGPLGTHSRLLTKRQLANMAIGVRDLSKQLSRVTLRLTVKTVFVLTKAHDETLIEKTRELVEWLLSDDRPVQYIVYVENTLEHNSKFNATQIQNTNGGTERTRLRYWTNELAAKQPHTFDFAITLGGDGTLLYASWLFQRIVPPVLSFSLGSLGFLTKFDFANYKDTLTTAFRDGVTVSLRLRFEGTVMQSRHHKQPDCDLLEELIGEEAEDHHTHKPVRTFEILNDIVVDRGPNPTMSALEVFGDDEHFTTIQADGICVATPTGSTAYNLAAGGSLCHPDNPVILLTAICAHTLSFRPIILPDTIVLRIGVPYDARSSSWASFDGRERVELCPGDYVTISASRYPFANVLPPGRRTEDWIGSISRTLNWNSRQKQKAFRDWSP